MGWQKGKPRKLLDKMVETVKESFSPAAVQEPQAILTEDPVVHFSVSLDDPLDKAVTHIGQEGTEMIVKLVLPHDVYDHLKTVCEGRGQSFSDCISQSLQFSRDNGFL